MKPTSKYYAQLSGAVLEAVDLRGSSPKRFAKKAKKFAAISRRI